MPTRFLLLVLLTAAAAGPLAGQARGVLEGRVYADAGIPLADAEVVVSGPGGAVVAHSTSDRAGGWRVAGLEAGTYSLTFRRIGYRPQSLTVTLPLPAGVDGLVVRLEPVPVSLDSLVVSAPVPAIDLRSTDLGARVTVREITLLPVALDAQSLASMLPGVQPDHAWGGASAQANGYLLDGAAVTHPGLGGAFFTPSVSWIESFTVRGLGAGAEVGEFQGGLVDIVTRSGGNRVEGALRTSAEADALNGGNLVPGEFGQEVDGRWELDGQVRGPVVRDRLHYALFGHVIQTANQVLNRVPDATETYTSPSPTVGDFRGMLKLSWQPGDRDLMQANVAGRSVTTEHGDQTGLEAPEATRRVTDRALTWNASWQHTWSPGSALEFRLSGFTGREQHTPYGGDPVPAVRELVSVDPATWRNADLRTRSEPSSLSATLGWTLRGRLAGLEHDLRIGGEAALGGWRYEEIRNGGMSWRPYRQVSGFDPEDPSTWATLGAINSSWGGEVRLDSEVRSGAVYLQDYIQINRRLRVTPGLRMGWWSGRLTPPGRPTFTAVSASGLAPRIGAVLDVDGRGRLVAKGHWGRYHQGMFAALFDRASGSDVFTDEETWAYTGPAFSDPATTFTEAERDALARAGLYTLVETERLTETGPVEDYRQPYVDQTMVSLETALGPHWRAAALYAYRRNEDMVALIDRNAAANHMEYAEVLILDRYQRPISYNGEPIVLGRLALSNEDIIYRWNLAKTGQCFRECLPPGVTPQQAEALRYDPDLVLTNVPEAYRRLHQVQLQVDGRYPSWWVTGSVTLSDLRGNYNVVTGPDDYANSGAGPWVRPNEQYNFDGFVRNQNVMEVKLLGGGVLPWGFRGGAFGTWVSGERVGPILTVSSLLLEYRVVVPEPGNPAATDTVPINEQLFRTTTGHRMFVTPRGEFRNLARFNLDLRLERSFPTRRTEVVLTLDAFNVLGASTVTDYETVVNSTGIFMGTTYGTVKARMPPRTIRLGAAARF